MDLLLLGGSGFVGGALRGLLPGAVAPDRRALDLADPAAVRAFLAAARPRVVLNLAGAGVDPADRDEARLHALNATLPRLLAEELAADAVLVHAGSAAELGRGTDADEQAEATPTSAYGLSKLRGSQAVVEVARRRGLRAVVARLYTVYGPGERPHRLLPTLLAAAADPHRRPVALSAGRQRRDFTAVGDVARVLVELAQCAPAGGALVNVATGRLLSVRDFALQAAAVLGLPAQALAFGALPDRDDDQAHGPVPLDRLRALGVVPPATDVPEGVAAAWRGRA